MKPILLLLSLLGLVLSCSGLPQVVSQDDSAAPQSVRECRGPFLDGDWQLLHSIEATLPGGHKGFLMGLSVISSSNRTARCVIMTLEGFVVFDALYDKQISVKRAVAPFDSEVFARGLIEDINLIFFKPDGALKVSGLLKSGAAVCRYQKPDGRWVDIINRGAPDWEIRQYSPDNRLARTVKLMSAGEPGLSDQKGIAEKIELKAHGSPGYELVMELVEAIPLTE
ncbi:MAG: hypothetical protein QNL14_06865 [Deltaproteobacteria bacterium]|nr:hypothetical protein [Deltaproteobacteria bacterium]